MLAGNQILLREDSGDPDDALDDEGVARPAHRAELRHRGAARVAAGGEPATLVVCDYGLGALPAPVRAWLVANRDRYATVALDAHDLADWRGLPRPWSPPASPRRPGCWPAPPPATTHDRRGTPTPGVTCTWTTRRRRDGRPS